MSKIALKPANTGSATFTLEAPATNTNRTLTLPDGDGTILSDVSDLNGSNLTGNVNTSLLSGTVDKTIMPAGSVIQVVQGTTSTQVSTTSSSYIDTGLSASITPTSNNSKILIIVGQSIRHVDFSDNDSGCSLQLLRNSLPIHGDNQPFEFFLNVGNTTRTDQYTRAILNFLDTPNTTSSVNYKTQIIKAPSADEVRAQSNGIESTITLMEIAG